MKKFFLLFFLLSIFCLIPLYLFAFGGCESNCMKCHNLKPAEAKELLKPLIPDALVEQVSIAPAKGLWEVVYSSKGKKGLAYLDFSLQNIIIGQIIEIKTKSNLTRERMMHISRVDFSSIPLENSLVLGDRNVKNKIVVFSDPDCPYCRKLHDELVKVVARQKDIAFYIKLFPLAIHKDSRRKSESIICADSLSLLEDAYAKKEIPDPSCNKTYIDENISLAKRLGITGTPALIFGDGSVVPGFIEADEILQFSKKAGS